MAEKEAESSEPFESVAEALHLQQSVIGLIFLLFFLRQMDRNEGPNF